MQRKITRQLSLGQVKIGGGAPISVQSMNNTETADIASTCRQLVDLAEAGAEIGRLAVPNAEAAAALPQIKAKSPLPLVADIHFDYRLALASIKAGVSGLRINPGNIGGPDKVRELALAAKAVGIPIRIGVNGGSLDADLLQKHGGVTPDALCESALRQAELLEDNGFFDIKLSLKCSNLLTMIAAYEKISELADYPLHIGVTEAGPLYRGSVKNAIGIGTLLSHGIGDTLRVSLTADPLKEVALAREILLMLGLYPAGWEIVSCPTCGRTQIDLIKLTEQVEASLAPLKPKRHIKVAVMGCAVNGPGEAKDADLGIAGGSGGGLIFCHGEKIDFYQEEDLLARFLRLAEKICQE